MARMRRGGSGQRWPPPASNSGTLSPSGVATHAVPVGGIRRQRRSGRAPSPGTVYGSGQRGVRAIQTVGARPYAMRRAMGEDMGEGTPGGLLRLKAVSDPSDGQDVHGIGGIGLDLLAKALDVGVERAAVTGLSVAPDAAHALLAGHHVARFGDQQRQQG